VLPSFVFIGKLLDSYRSPPRIYIPYALIMTVVKTRSGIINCILICISNFIRGRRNHLKRVKAKNNCGKLFVTDLPDSRFVSETRNKKQTFRGCDSIVTHILSFHVTDSNVLRASRLSKTSLPLWHIRHEHSGRSQSGRKEFWVEQMVTAQSSVSSNSFVKLTARSVPMFLYHCNVFGYLRRRSDW
jgi:hypothetical protein